MTKDTDHDKIIRVEEKINALASMLDEVKNNHLAHISSDLKELHEKVDSINVKMGMWVGGAVVVMWVVERFFK